VSTDQAISDDALNRRVIGGDRAAFDVLVARHQARLRGFLRKLCGHASTADDLAQETFVRAWQRCRQFDGRDATSSYAAWLVRIGWRVFLDHERHEQHLQRKHARAAETLEAVEPNYGAQLDVAAALAELPVRERACLLLCDAEGWSHTEAAQLMKLPLGTLKSIVARAREIVRRRLSVTPEQS
jgi:RNA polymerase sigma-70 factor (ECF subfamily)